MILPQKNLKIIVMAAILSLAACASESAEKASASHYDDLGLTENAATDAALQKAYDGLSLEMKTAAKTKSDGFCNFAKLPDAVAERQIDDKSFTYNTDASPEEIYAFYRTAAEAQGGKAEATGDVQLRIYDAKLTNGSGERCRASMTTQFTGNSNVTIALIN